VGQQVIRVLMEIVWDQGPSSEHRNMQSLEKLRPDLQRVFHVLCVPRLRFDLET
jgi:hypothetical protein